MSEVNSDIFPENEDPQHNEFDNQLRPKLFDDFSGQKKIKDNLKIFVEAANKRAEALDHVLLYGPPGLGKTTLATIIANELNANLKITSGPILDKPGDLAGLLTNLQERDVLFIDEIHRLSPVVEEYLYSAMEDFRIDIMIESGPSAKSVQINLNKFTLIGATTRAGLLSSPLRDRFGIVSRLNYYEQPILSQIVSRSAKILQVEIEDIAAKELASRSRGTPRIANSLLKRVSDFALIKGDGFIDKKITDFALSSLNVDINGLNQMDKDILLTIIEKFNGGPVGLTTIATAVGEEANTIEEIYEPFLIQQGYLERTQRGRVATKKAYEYLNIPFTGSKKDLFS